MKKIEKGPEDSCRLKGQWKIDIKWDFLYCRTQLYNVIDKSLEKDIPEKSSN